MDQNTQPGADGAADQTPVDVIALDTPATPISPREAGRALAAARAAKREKEQAQEPAANSSEATADPVDESAQADAAPLDEATGETQDADPAVEEQPPLDRPRSWSKEREAVWAKLDRETQEYLVEHDREVSKVTRNAQNEAAEKLKGLTAKEQEVEQARHKYESALPVILQYAAAMYEGEFSDIKTMDDVQRLATDDPLRYTRWDAQQKRLAALQQEVVSAQHRQTSERMQGLEAFKASEGRRLRDALPDLADPQKLSKAQTAAIAVLTDVGFKDEELHAAARGERDISVHDHRFQVILHEAAQYRAMKERAKDIKSAPKPPVQRPGVGKPKGADADARIQALTSTIDKSSGLKALRAGAALLRERRAAQR